MTAPTPKELATAVSRVALRSFLDAGCTLDLRPAAPPRVSVLLLLYNRAELTLACLHSLAARLNATPFEVIVVDNASTDETPRLLERVRGLTVVRNAGNVGYPKGVNQAAARASGEYLLLLNNDAEVLGRAIDEAVTFLDANPDAGAVGGKVVLLDGTLQEAGCIIWQDGWTDQYGRGGRPDDPAVNFRRDVDYCSGAFLMSRRELFERLGGLDEVFSPGYFEDSDYCARLRQAGRRVVFLPEVVTLHYESASAGGLSNVSALAHRNHDIFAARNAGWLRGQPHRWVWTHLEARLAGDHSLKCFFLADAAAAGAPGEALAAIERVAKRVEACGGFLTVGLTGTVAERLRPLWRRLPRTVEAFRFGSRSEAAAFLAGRAGYYDLAILGDPAEAEVLAGCGEEGPRVALWRGGRFTLLGEQASATPRARAA